MLGKLLGIPGVTPGIFGRSEPAWLYIFQRANRVISKAERGSPPGPGDDPEAVSK